MLVKVSQKLVYLAKLFPTDLYVVGGFVRNFLMGLITTDIDICGPATIDEIKKALDGSEFVVKVKNETLGAITISSANESFEYTTFRTEVCQNDGSHTPKEVFYTDSIEEDSKRRDFTINSIYYNIKKDEIVDLHHGVVDIQQRIIRSTTNPSQLFIGDGLRILRMIRFSSELGFKIEKNTFKSAKKNISALEQISGERKYEEIAKILESGTKYNKTDILAKQRVLIGLENLNKLKAWKYFGLSCKKVKFDMLKKIPPLGLAFLIDIIDSENPVCMEAFLEKLLKGFKVSKKKIEKIEHLLSAYYEALNHLDNKTYFFKYFDCFTEIRPYLQAKNANLCAKYFFFYSYIISHKLAISEKDLKINGQDLEENFPTLDKKAYSKVLAGVLDKVFDGKIANDKTEILNYLKATL